MPASRILEGRLPQQHPTRRYLAAQPKLTTKPEGISRAKPVA